MSKFDLIIIAGIGLVLLLGFGKPLLSKLLPSKKVEDPSLIVQLKQIISYVAVNCRDVQQREACLEAADILRNELEKVEEQ